MQMNFVGSQAIRQEDFFFLDIEGVGRTLEYSWI